MSLGIAVYTLWQANPDRMERLGRNAAVGMRSVATTKSEKAWNSAHKAAWPKVKQGAIALIVGSLISTVVLLHISDDSGLWWGSAVFMSYLAYLWLLILGFRHGNQAARDISSPRNDACP